ncbi:hypothetical protein LU293_06735 [Moraxella nasovis]|uniref:hypothetical protein n=1 Tax=Moraxella nasovis TaxID=2904121 RepID=UPI001F61DAA1|nr:hypothetical protein [Moraxella nasovis]UNU72799.1 hypothetical protein LU293_06735 [Moraxella nasovis]
MNNFDVSMLAISLGYWEKAYIVASLIVAVMIWIEATMLSCNDGKLPEQVGFMMVSMITSSWLVISGLALWFLEFDSFAMAVPVMYGVYSVLGWFYGAKLMAKTDVPDNPADFVVPAKYLVFSKSFAIAFAILSIFVLCTTYFIP